MSNLSLQRLLGVLCLGLIAVVAMLWQRLRVLEHSVEKLSQSQSTADAAYLKLPLMKSRLLFPSDVERAMLGEAHSRVIEISPQQWRSEINMPQELRIPNSPLRSIIPPTDDAKD